MTEEREEELHEMRADVFGGGQTAVDVFDAEIGRLSAQLPEGMQHCTIRFIECPVGHGRLTATNWVDHGCTFCELAALRERVAKAERWLADEGALNGAARYKALEILRGA
jgi:hypothetical protein